MEDKDGFRILVPPEKWNKLSEEQQKNVIKTLKETAREYLKVTGKGRKEDGSSCVIDR